MKVKLEVTFHYNRFSYWNESIDKLMRLLELIGKLQFHVAWGSKSLMCIKLGKSRALLEAEIVVRRRLKLYRVAFVTRHLSRVYFPFHKIITLVFTKSRFSYRDLFLTTIWCVRVTKLIVSRMLTLLWELFALKLF